jgi:hypothetical protein
MEAGEACCCLFSACAFATLLGHPASPVHRHLTSGAIRRILMGMAVHYAATVPGIYGDAIAFAAEMAISFVLMSATLFVSNHEVLAPYPFSSSRKSDRYLSDINEVTGSYLVSLRYPLEFR